MASHFFGQFLLDLGEIDEEQLEQALLSIDEIDLPIGQLAVRSGVLDQAQVDQIKRSQQGHSELFGQLALGLGLLDSKTLDTLLEEQRATHLYIGDALVRNGALSSMKLAELLDRFKESEGHLSAPRIPAELRDHLLGITILELLPRLALRAAHVMLKVVAVRDWIGPSTLPHGVSMDVEARSNSISVGLAIPTELGFEFASGMLCCDQELINEDDIEDSLGEFLNILVGNMKVKLDRNEPEIAPSSYEGIPQSGYAVDFETTAGSGMLILSLL